MGVVKLGYGCKVSARNSWLQGDVQGSGSGSIKLLEILEFGNVGMPLLMNQLGVTRLKKITLM